MGKVAKTAGKKMVKQGIKGVAKQAIKTATKAATTAMKQTNNYKTSKSALKRLEAMRNRSNN